MRALVVTNMYPTATAPARGSFVRDQVRALEQMPDVQLELFTFEPGGGAPYVRAAREVRARYRGGGFDVVHAHFGLTAWPALTIPGPHVLTLHGTDLVHPRSRAITLAALPFIDLVAPVSRSLAELIPRWLIRGRSEVLPCGVDVKRFVRIDRADARRELGLDPEQRYLLFPADPARPEKRYDRALAVAGDVAVLVLRNVDPTAVPLWVNAADAVLIPSERESFGLSVLEALACDVPVLATPVGIAPEALQGVAGTHCAQFDAPGWRAALEQILRDPDPRVSGRAVAERYSAERMAAQVLEAWRSL